MLACQKISRRPGFRFQLAGGSVPWLLGQNKVGQGYNQQRSKEYHPDHKFPIGTGWLSLACIRAVMPAAKPPPSANSRAARAKGALYGVAKHRITEIRKPTTQSTAIACPIQLGGAFCTVLRTVELMKPKVTPFYQGISDYNTLYFSIQSIGRNYLFRRF